MTAPEREDDVLAPGVPGGTPASSEAALDPGFGKLHGRGRELALLSDMLNDPYARLITLTGPAGVGKSHLAHAVLTGGARHGGTRCVSVDLADAPDAWKVWASVGTATAQDAAERIGAAELLLVLDNCDPVARSIALDISALLRACAGLKVLVTSRVSLDVRAERILPVAPLPTGAGSPAVQLFLDRVRPYYRAGLADGPGQATVTDICAELGGIPLAIEMTAEAVGTQGPLAVLDRLRKGEHTDGRRPRDAPARHRSITSALTWADHVLTTGDRELLRNLAVFENVVDLAAVERASGLDREAAAAGVESLVHNSLLLSVGGQDGEPEFRLTHMARIHYRKELVRDNAALGPALDRYVAHWADFATATAAGLRAGQDVTRLLFAVEARLPDLRKAVRHLRSLGDHTAVLRLLTSLEVALLGHGLAPDAADAIERSATAPDVAAREGALAAEALMSVARWALGRGEHRRAGAALDRAVGVAAGLPGVRAKAAGLTGELLRRRGETAAAGRVLESALKELDAVGDLHGVALARGSQSLVRAAQGDTDAEQPVLSALEQLRAGAGTESPWSAPDSPATVQAALLTALSRVQRLLGRVTEAYEAAREAMRLLLGSGGPAAVAEALEAVATVAGAATEEDLRAVARALAHAEAVRRRHKLVSDDAVALRVLADRLREDIDAAVLCQLQRSAQQASLRDALVAGLFAPPPPPPPPPPPEQPAAAAAPADTHGLTPRQHQIARLVAEGLTNRQIARQLDISEWTVVNHLRVVMQKLECASRVHVVRAMQKGR